MRLALTPRLLVKMQYNNQPNDANLSTTALTADDCTLETGTTDAWMCPLHIKITKPVSQTYTLPNSHCYV